jgi:hypothetical protein
MLAGQAVVEISLEHADPGAACKQAANDGDNAA